MFRLKYRTGCLLKAFLSQLALMILSLVHRILLTSAFPIMVVSRLFIVFIFSLSMPVYAASIALTDVTDIATGNGFSCVVTDIGKVRCWGSNDNNSLGDGTAENTQYPSYVIGISDGATAVTAGTNHACAIVDGGVKCWGNNDSGQLGTGNTTASSIAVDVSGLGAGSKVTKISAGYSNTCAIVDNNMQCWGNNDYGKLGDASFDSQLTPVTVKDLTSVTDIATGEDFTCAVIASGTVKCWGRNNNGQLGNDSNTDETTPNTVSGILSGATKVSAKFEHACAVVDSGVLCWGLNDEGQLGNGTLSSSIGGQASPVQAIPDNSGVTDVSTGHSSTCALFSGGAVQCWGSDDIAQLANELDGSQVSPYATTINTDITVLDSSIDKHRCAIVGGEAWCWGQNNELQSGGDAEPSLIIDAPQSVFDNLCLAQTDIPTSECEALVSLYVATEGHNWSDKSGNNWLKTDAPCDWSGVICDDPATNVVAILRDGLNLTGEIPDLSALSQLQELHLSTNNLTGDLQGVSDLSELIELKLDNNQLTSMETDFPSNLQLLYLHSNKLTGSIPSNLPTSLTDLLLYKNTLTGEIPDLTNFFSLNAGDFSYNALSSAENPSSLENIDSDWLNTQTVPVSNVTATVISETEVQIAWTPIAYTSDDGYYTIRYGTSSDSYDNSVNTADKSISNQNITDLTEGTKYYFVVETYTPIHSGQSNALTSDYSEEISATPETSCNSVVTNENDDGSGSLRQAVTEACAGGTITFSDSLTINLSSEITINKDLSIDGQSNSVIIDGGNSTRLFYLPNGNKSVTLKNLTMQNAQTSGNDNNGGAIIFEGKATATIDQCLFKSNKAVSQADGGAIAIKNGNNYITITNSTFDSNQAHQGGAAIRVWDSGLVSIANSTFVNNSMSEDFFSGGAISLTQNSVVEVTNSTFYKNSANRGGAIIASSSTLTVNNSTFSENYTLRADSGSTHGNGTSIYVEDSSLTMNNSILANSSTPSESECYITSSTVLGSNNIIEDGSCLSNGLTTAELSVDPKLASSPADNDGLTSTIILYGNSVGVDAGNSLCEDLDQRGTARSSTCDIGAYEFVPPEGSTVVN
uniref:RCC1 domain-containing protein n=1 Tax=Candidatus Albibeggiatoa sp. nov. BB20 TaxID=3162723 RepID=UPI0033657A4B